MLAVRRGNTAYAIVAIAKELYPQNIVTLGRLVKTAEEIVQGFNEFSYRQRNGEAREIDDVRVKDAHVVVCLDVQITEIWTRIIQRTGNFVLFLPEEKLTCVDGP